MDKKRFKKILSNLFSIKYEGYTKIVMILGMRFRFYDYKACLQDTNQLIRDINFKQNLVMDYFMDSSEAKVATGALRNRQLENLELLKEFIRICKCLQVEYWLDYGSLLGAVRHGKTVPWDDDLDVAITEEDAQNLSDNIYDVLHKNYDFISVVDGCQYRITYKDRMDAFIDIYIEREQEGLYFYLGLKDCLKKSDYITHNAIFPLRDIEFEGVKVSAPCDYDKYLRNKYGNYVLLPKKEHLEPGHEKPKEHIVFKE